MQLKFVCWKFSDFENLHKAPKKIFFSNFFFHHSLAKTFLFKYFQENFLFFNFHHEIHEKQRKFVNEKLPLR